MELWIIWLILAVVLIIIEVLSQMVWALCLTVGCVAALSASLFGCDLVWQLVILAVATILFFFVGTPWFQRLHERAAKKEKRSDRTGMDALLGRHAKVVEAIYPDRLGRVRIDGDNWQVRIPKLDRVVEVGTEVVVLSYDSIILDVEPIKQ